jgi:phosphate/sulfate permease
VSFAHGSNDGQKGLGLIMLILIGCVPTAYALNRAMPDSRVEQYGDGDLDPKRDVFGGVVELAFVGSETLARGIIERRLARLQHDAIASETRYISLRTLLTAAVGILRSVPCSLT